LETDTGDIYVFYGGKSDGSETLGTAINIYYKLSTDDGATWGSETKLNTGSSGSFRVLKCTPRFTDGDFTVVFHRITSFAADQHTSIFNILLPDSVIGDDSPVAQIVKAASIGTY
jgi:hypothetical protein